MSQKNWPHFIQKSLDFLLVFAWAALIFYFSNQSTLPSFDTSLSDFLFKKGAHMFMYAVLYFLLFRALAPTDLRLLNRKNYLLPFLLCLLYSISDEIHQSFTPSRHPSPRDVGYDLLGASCILLYQHKYL